MALHFPTYSEIVADLKNKLVNTDQALRVSLDR